MTLKGHTSCVQSLVFSPDGKRLATASWDSTAKLWDAETGRELLTLNGHTGEVLSVAFSPDGKRLATASNDNTVKLWDAETGREIVTLRGRTAWVVTVVFSPDGKRLATASQENVAKLWDAETGRELLTLEGHSGDVLCAVFSPDGKRLVTASIDKTAKLWDVETGRELLTLGWQTSGLQHVAFSPDLWRIAAASADATAIIWNAFPWRDEDLPGNATMSYDERIEIYRLALEKYRAAQTQALQEKRARETPQLEACLGNLRHIHAALVRYRVDHNGQMPNWLSDLVPQYLTSETLLCQTDTTGSSPYNRDPKMRCSYSYEFNPTPMALQYQEKYGKTTREWKEKQLKELGDVVPVVRCMHHGARVLNLGYGGRPYPSPLKWEKGDSGRSYPRPRPYFKWGKDLGMQEPENATGR
jgi:hypothetical protein